MGMSMIDRIGALCGVVGVPLSAAAVFLVDPVSPLEASPTASSKVVVQALAKNAGDAQAGAWCGLAGALLLAVFFARLYGALRTSTGPDSWLPHVVLLGGSAYVAMVLVGVGFAFAAGDSDSLANNPQVAMMIILFGWYFPAVYAPGTAAVMFSVTAVALTTKAFPTWFTWAAGAVLVGIVLISATGAAGMAAVAGFFGLLMVAAVLVFHADRSTARPAAATPGADLTA